MAAPVGHIICALALLNSGMANISDRNAFIAGSSFPDIRYISPVDRAKTHRLADLSLAYVLDGSDFEKGRRFHPFVDKKREAFMRERNAYRFFQGVPLKTQLFKLAEDQVLFYELKDKINAKEIFSKIYDEERNYGISDTDIFAWHKILTTYLDHSYWFNITRYYASLLELKNIYDKEKGLFQDLWQSIRTIGFFIYAYFKVEWVSHDKEFREMVLDFYHNKIHEIIKEENQIKFTVNSL